MSRAATLSACAVALVLAGCASGGTGTTAAGSHAAGSHGPAGTFALARGRPTKMYKVALTGRAETTAGAPSGRGDAIIAFHGPALVCWRFAHLHGFFQATLADIHTGRAGQAGAAVVHLSTGPRLHHQGCVSIRPATTRMIWANPGGYYVSIVSAQHPRGAVRAQL